MSASPRSDARRGAPALPGGRTVWDLAVVVLGANIWVSFLLLPVLHMERSPGAAVATLMALSPIALAVGAWLRQRVVLLGVYPGLLLLPALLAPGLVGVNVYSPWTFLLVAASFLAYLLGVPLMLSLMETPASPEVIRELEPFPWDAKWRRRVRIYRGMAAASAIFPAALVYALYVDPTVRAALVASYPARAAEATVMFGAGLLALWIGLFHTYFLGPLRAHVRSDPQLRYELDRTRQQGSRRGPRPSFYVFVTVALVLMLLLTLRHW